MKPCFSVEYMASMELAYDEAMLSLTNPQRVFQNLKIFRPSRCQGPDMFWLTKVSQKTLPVLPVPCGSPDCGALCTGALLLLNKEQQNKIPNPRHQQIQQAADHS